MPAMNERTSIEQRPLGRDHVLTTITKVEADGSESVQTGTFPRLRLSLVGAKPPVIFGSDRGHEMVLPVRR